MLSGPPGVQNPQFKGTELSKNGFAFHPDQRHHETLNTLCALVEAIYLLKTGWMLPLNGLVLTSVAHSTTARQPVQARGKRTIRTMNPCARTYNTGDGS